uniref:peptidylprolyl isomerase n=1 Tax=Dunaliella tertiolecta TaxID=3047 RepID=A0A7S3QTC1_DUNTE|mmetsp:Transcript_1143/g.2704  ORF Transcript_1143/g.2704 Transcript_1143/m.2704 type:complete len:657 (+) Transcript_1143:168-2138(+)|eukprot:CAMPEP_0202349062 /NCGR_PEP_ID=MMETSP1126-20121109/6711_1 /ASSEMBLY_ACC=CAM_ASM_000457 /TAXON_ID=3047 /ORGANISM="Dunaliella tertiolecta, Strain CCMP1320" /LENGTH=656 /DNA_ID=CAMNT_0048940811 /DNA_START=141 /DNA_END=2111 /DNA_ORIENTATION=+
MEEKRGVDGAPERSHAGEKNMNAEAEEEEEEEQEAGPPRPPAEEEEAPDVGPVMPPSKKRKALEFEDQYLKQLPTAQMYERSYMHRDTVTHVMVTPSDFIITASVDGCLKFWKKQQEGIEFVKLYRAHVGAVDDLACSCDGYLLASLSRDKTVKVYDVLNFDMIVMIRTPFVPGCVQWIFKRGEARARLAISDFNSGDIYVYDARSGSSEPIHVHKVHRFPVTAMRYNAPFDTVISTDQKGFLEYWDGTSYEAPSAPTVSFTMKLDTNLFDLAKAKTVAHCIEVDKSGLKFVTVSKDRRIRVFKFKTGKLMRAYDESLEAAHELQRSGHEAFVLEDIDFGRRLAVEKEIATAETAPPPNAVFDESGNFLLYPSLLGIKVVNLVTNQVCAVLGKVENTERFLRVALFQGTANKKAKMKIPTVELLDKIPQPDPTLVCCAFKRQRLFLFSKREPKDVEEAEGAEAAAAAVGGRDVFNEKPSLEDILTAEGEAGDALVLPRGITIHTNKGDITAKLFPDECPKTVENFTTHAKNGYYDNVIFHRVIKGFMIQTGDPLGDGTGGESIWGGEFQDEFHKMLRHDRPGILSMANAGPNTNGSQFFITTVPCSWLDNKHTVFGRVVKGMDVVHMIEKAKVNKEDRPYEDIKIVNMTAHDTVDV